jgi:hypothetical protein
VPGDLASTVDLHHRGAVDRTVLRFGALACGVDRGMLEEEYDVIDLVGNPPRVGVSLQLPGSVILHGVVAESGVVERQHKPIVPDG